MSSSPSLTPDLASRLARLALAHVTREYPNKLDHVLNKRGDLKSPRELHPVFFGSFDWHSCVHGYWLLATLLRHFPKGGDGRGKRNGMSEADEIEALFDSQLTVAKVKSEVKYLAQPLRATFERPYGWAWLLMFAAGLAMRASIALPIEQRANWIFRMTERETARVDQLRAVVRLMRQITVGLPLVLIAPLEGADQTEAIKTFLDVGVHAVDILISKNFKSDIAMLSSINRLCTVYAAEMGVKPEQVELEIGKQYYRFVKFFNIAPQKPLPADALDFDSEIVSPIIVQGYCDARAVIQHFLETKATDVAVGRSINCIAECHVVGGHGLGDGACCAAHAEKSPRYFLTGANFSEGPVPGCL